MDIRRETIGVNEAAKILGFSRYSAYLAIRTGELPAIRLGKRIVVPRNAVERLLRTGNIAISVDSSQ